MKIGILTIPGDPLFIEIGENSQLEVVLVEKKEELVSLDGLILAGKDKLILADFLAKKNLVEPIKRKAKEGMPLWGVGAGLLMLAKTPEASLDKVNISLDLMDIIAIDHGFDEKTKESLYIPALGYEAVISFFDHAPYISEVAPHIGIMAYHKEKIVMARQGNLLASAFFTEKEEKRVVNYFLGMIKEALEQI